MPARQLLAVVVGGSLSGLCATLALAKGGWSVVTIERAAGEPPGGAGLGLDRPLLGRITGVDATAIPVVSGNRDSAAWSLVRQYLVDLVRRTFDVEALATTLEDVSASNITGGLHSYEQRRLRHAQQLVHPAFRGVKDISRRYRLPQRRLGKSD